MNTHGQQQVHQPWTPHHNAPESTWPAYERFDNSASNTNTNSNNTWAHRQQLPIHHATGDDWKRTLRRLVRRYLPGAALPFLSGGSPSSISVSTLQTNTALPAPSPATMRFLVLCALWYTTSALSSNTGKLILNRFRYPVTLTIVQFAFVSGYCLLAMSPLVRFSRMRAPSRAIVRATLPMGLFQVGGHMFSSMAISRVPVSTVHTIKALSPLFTVAAYAMLFGVSYSTRTYASLLPLTLGVMLACTFDMSGSNLIGLLCAFGSALVFVSSNIFFKKVMPSGPGQTASHKLDKTNLLFYSSGMAFLLMIPIWVFSDLPALLSSASSGEDLHLGGSHPAHGHSAPHSVPYYFVLNGTVHFAQNIIAFVILASVSPVTYSIASLIKRVAVICIAIVWFAQRVHPIQAVGILLTFAGLWMYNSAKGDVARGENKVKMVEARREMMLPTTKAEQRILDGTATPPTEPVFQGWSTQTTTGVVPQQRSRARTIVRPPPISSHAAQHGYPNLHIKIVPDTPSQGASYPSPPLSGDSPPPHQTQLPQLVPVH